MNNSALVDQIGLPLVQDWLLLIISLIFERRCFVIYKQKILIVKY